MKRGYTQGRNPMFLIDLVFSFVPRVCTKPPLVSELLPLSSRSLIWGVTFDMEILF